MSNPGFRLLVILACLATGRPAKADDDENYKRLASMPRERRVVLSENLERFDKLDPADQAEVRRLDTELAKKSPEAQARYRALLRNYHLWVSGLSQEKQDKLREAKTTEARFNLATKYRAEEKEPATKPLPRVMGVRIGDYGMVGPFEAAHLLKVWQKLSPAEQAAIAKKPGRGEILKALRTLGRSHKIFGPTNLPPEEIKGRADGFNRNPDFQNLLGPVAQKYNANLARSIEEFKKKQVEATSKGADAPLRHDHVPPRFEHDYAEFLYFEEHRPHLVLHTNLDRFIAANPPWFLELVDSLCPDDARDFMTIVYRLLYPNPEEIPDPSKLKSDANKPPNAPPGKGAAKRGPAPE